MNALDLAILGVIALSAVFAFARGFVREALSIVAWVGAALITLYGFNYVYGSVVRFVTTPLLADLIAGAGLFVVSLIVLTILTGFLARFVQLERPFADRSDAGIDLRLGAWRLSSSRLPIS